MTSWTDEGLASFASAPPSPLARLCAALRRDAHELDVRITVAREPQPLVEDRAHVLARLDRIEAA